MLCIMHEGEPYGHLTIGGKAATLRQIGTLTGVGEKEAIKLVGELEDAGVFSRSDSGVIFSRRMVRDNEKSEEGRKNVGKRTDRSPPDTEPATPPSTPPSRGADTLEARSRIQEARSKKAPPKPPEPGGSVCASDSDRDFCEFWEAYPRKDAKGDARKAWISAVSKAKPHAIVAGCRGYKFDANPRFVPLPATWLNGERWLQAAESDGMDPTLKAAGVTQAMLDEYLSGTPDPIIVTRKMIQ